MITVNVNALVQDDLMTKIWIFFFIFLALFIGTVFALPYALVFTIVFWPLFAFVSLLPAILFYILIILFALGVAKKLEIKRKKIFSLIFVFMIALGIPLISNIITFSKIHYLKAFDKEMSVPTPTGDTIILTHDSHTNRSCGSLCQKLLYNSAFKNVILNSPNSIWAFHYTIEKRNECPSVPYTPNNINMRIASGECLIEKKLEKDQVKGDYLYKFESVSSSPRHYKQNPLAIAVWGLRTSLINNLNDENIFQRTEVKARPLFAPLLIGGVGGYQLDFDVGFARYDFEFKDFNNRNEIAKSVFKKYFQEPVSDHINKLELIKKSLDSTSSEKLAGNRLLEQYLGELWRKKKTPTQEDISLVIRALKDERVDQFWDLGRFNSLLDSIPDSLIMAMGERVAKDGNPSVSGAINGIPRVRANIIYPELQKVIRTSTLRSKSMWAMVRLSDGGSKATAEYITILKEYSDYLASVNKNKGKPGELSKLTKKFKALGEAPKASVKGLCYLGRDGLEAKSVLYASINENNPKFIEQEIIKTLLNMDLEKELSKKYENNERLMKIISIKARSKAARERKNRDVCK